MNGTDAGSGQPPEWLTVTELESITDPALLLERAWALQPEMRISERVTTLNRLEALLDSGDAVPEPPDRDWRLELLAERALDAAMDIRMDESLRLSDQVLSQAGPGALIARARALLGRGHALAWKGTDETTARGDRALLEAVEAFAELEHAEWQAYAIFCRGYTVAYEGRGDLVSAAALMKQALVVMPLDSRRRATTLTFYADILTDGGELDAAESALAEAAAFAERSTTGKWRSEVAWSRARVATCRGDAGRAERLLCEAERDSADWLNSTVGAYFFLEAADMLDRLGRAAEAGGYLRRGSERVRARGSDPDSDDTVRQVRASMLARSGDPLQALVALQDLMRGEWLEKRQVWRFSLLSAWAALRAGDRGRAGELAALALEQALACGSVAVATASEPDLTRALAPLAERCGSAAARRLMLAGRDILIRLFGAPTVTRADGTVLEVPPGQPGELLRMLALHEHGLHAEVVIEALFPAISPDLGRARLRRILHRLRQAAGDIVVRDGEGLRLVPAWVDTREFMSAAGRVNSATGPRRVQLANAALALHGGPLLPLEPYADWATEIRDQIEHEHALLLKIATEPQPALPW